MEIRLNKESINTAIEKLNNLKEEVTDISLTRIVSRLVDEGMKEANDYTMGAAQSGLEPSRIVGKTLKSGLAGYVALVGPNAVYDEFGAGNAVSPGGYFVQSGRGVFHGDLHAVPDPAAVSGRAVEGLPA